MHGKGFKLNQKEHWFLQRKKEQSFIIWILNNSYNKPFVSSPRQTNAYFTQCDGDLNSFTFYFSSTHISWK